MTRTSAHAAHAVHALALRKISDVAAPSAPPAPGSPEFDRTASHMAREFVEATAEIDRLVRAIRAQTDRMNAAFRTDPEDTYDRFGIQLGYDGQRDIDLDDLREAMERRAWYVLVDKSSS